ncbi:MAG: zinc ribbon domain-containing protein [Chloroflexi bacterium]|nr:zinc ribbon domain-containing protein [Chloroflexota bacterium]
MPLYEYRCQQCRRRFTVLLRSFSTEVAARCTACGSADVARLISTFAVLKSEESRLEQMSDPSWLGDVDENDPRSMARWMRRMGAELGEDLGPEFSEMVDRLEAGDDLGELGPAEERGAPGDGDFD